MAARSEEIKIILQTMGAAKARSDIEKVRKETNKLSNSIDRQNSTFRNAKKTLENYDDALDVHYDKLQKDTALYKHRNNIYKQGDKERERSATRATKAEDKRLRVADNAVENAIKNQKNLESWRKKASVADQKRYKQQQSAADFEKQWHRDRVKQNRELAKIAAQSRTIERQRNIQRIREMEAETRREIQLLRQIEREEKRLQRMREIHINKLRRHRANVYNFGSRGIQAFFGSGFHARAYRTMAIIAGILDLVPLLGTALNAAGAGLIGLVNGLGRVSGVLGAIPAGILGIAQTIGVLSMAFSGLGKAMGGDANALALLGPNARSFVNAINLIKPGYTNMQRSVQESVFAGMGEEIVRLNSMYLPMLQRSFVETARVANIAFRNFTGWAGSSEGRNTMLGVTTTNVVLAKNGMDAGQRMLQTFLMVANIAGPMISMMSRDLVTLSHSINNFVANNQGGIGAFFMRGYQTFKSVMDTIGDYAMGVYNIIKLASPLTDWMGRNIAEAGKEFRAWSESTGGIAAIAGYFDDMQPKLAALAELAGAVATGIFEISNQPAFERIVGRLTTEVVPKMVDIFKQMDGSFIDVFITLIEHIQQLALSGVINDIAASAETVANVLGKFIGILAGMPSWLRELLITGIMIRGVFGGAVAGAGSIATQGVMMATQYAAYRAGGGSIAGLLPFQAGRMAPGAAAAGGAMMAGGAPTLIPNGAGGFILAGGGAAAAASGTRTGRGADPRRAAGTTRGSSGPGKRGMGRFASARRGLGVARGAGAAGAGGGLMAMMWPILAFMAGYAALGQSVNFTNATSNQSIGEAQANLISGDFRSFFKTERGRTIGGGLFDKGGMGIGEALSAQNEMNGGWWSRTAYDLENKFVGLFGGRGRKQQVADSFSEIDTTLNNLVRSGNIDAAEQVFAQIYDQSKGKIPLQDLLDLFPQYRDYIESTIDPMDRAGLTAEQLARRMSGAATTLGIGPNAPLSGQYGSTSYIMDSQGNRIPIQNRGGNALQTRGQRVMSMYYSGGTAYPGQSYLTGELGPELTVDKSGRMGMVGLNGMEMFSPSSTTAVIPSSATFDPLGGNFGDAPSWARNALLGAGDESVGVGASANGGSTVIENNYSAKVDISGSDMSKDEIETMLFNTFRRMTREQEERK